MEKQKCPTVSQIARAASGYYSSGFPIKVAVEKAIEDFPPHTCNIDRQIGPLRIINDCESYGVTNVTTLRSAIKKVLGTHGRQVVSERKRSAA